MAYQETMSVTRRALLVALVFAVSALLGTARAYAADKYWIVGGASHNYYFVPVVGEQYPNDHEAVLTVRDLAGDDFDPQSDAPITLNPTTGTEQGNRLPPAGSSITATPTSDRDNAGEAKIRLTFNRDHTHPNGAAPRKFSTVAKWVVSRVTPIEVTFSDDISLKENTGDDDVPNMVYKDINADGDATDENELDKPVCYVKEAAAKVTVKFDVWPGFSGTKIWIKGVGLSNNVEFKTSQTVTGTSFTITDIADADQTVRDAIAIDEAKISWSACPKETEPSGGEYVSIGDTSHDAKLYIVLPTPVAPMAVPWTEVLDKACVWANGKVTAAAAAQDVTESLYDCGKFKYNTTDGTNNYTEGQVEKGTEFNLTEFLERLAGQTGKGDAVNCTDCSHAVVIFSNALGCGLYSHYLGNTNAGGFNTNKYTAIGRAAWTAPSWGWSFLYHSVAWLGNGGAMGGKVFDACLQVDSDSDPTANPPATAWVPVNIEFSKDGGGYNDYREKLVHPDHYASCLPQSAGFEKPGREGHLHGWYWRIPVK